MSLKDVDNIARLEQLRPRYERLRDLKIRNQAELERAEQDLLKAKEQARNIAGTDDENEIRNQIRANYQANTKAVDEFEQILNQIEYELSQIETGA